MNCDTGYVSCADVDVKTVYGEVVESLELQLDAGSFSHLQLEWVDANTVVVASRFFTSDDGCNFADFVVTVCTLDDALSPAVMLIIE